MGEHSFLVLTNGTYDLLDFKYEGGRHFEIGEYRYLG